MMKKVVFLVFIICVVSGFASAQKTVRKRPKTPVVQIRTDQNPAETSPQKDESDPNQSNPRQVKSNLFDTPVKILDKPRPQFFDGQDCSQGRVVLRVTFLSSGEIGTISVISSLTKGKTNSAVEAAQKIKFIPAKRNGFPVNVSRPVEYSFTIH